MVFYNSSRNAQQSFNQSLQTSLIQPESAQHKLEPHESVLPILVTEAITSVQRRFCLISKPIYTTLFV